MQGREYISRTTSNGEDVFPTLYAVYYKLPQRQADNSGMYIVEKVKIKKFLLNSEHTPFTSTHKI